MRVFDIDAGKCGWVERIKPAAKATKRPGVNCQGLAVWRAVDLRGRATPTADPRCRAV